jgi:hypothetical protein
MKTHVCARLRVARRALLVGCTLQKCSLLAAADGAGVFATKANDAMFASTALPRCTTDSRRRGSPSMFAARFTSGWLSVITGGVSCRVS